MTTTIRGELRIHHERGVIEFINTDNSFKVFELNNIPDKPIPHYDKPDQLYIVTGSLTTKTNWRDTK